MILPQKCVYKRNGKEKVCEYLDVIPDRKPEKGFYYCSCKFDFSKKPKTKTHSDYAKEHKRFFYFINNNPGIDNFKCLINQNVY